ncbi:ParB-like nuclease domain-containing protein [Lacrimispora sphenoides]|uniref:ParB/RepB/Spo0J family partition protein n=1 Tax=Lacrimispora sphenoides TaxID=29370 RepID=UPI0008BE1951|nr:hypothetical protein [Lacrimispora sphenoides]SET42908.1 ParB-like nuclease domain-containing protein [Lacrimispora sphenoides]
MGKFNNLNLDGKNPAFTKADVQSKEMETSKENVDSFQPQAGLHELVKAVDSSEQSNKAFNFKFIPREKIVFNKNNDFDMDEVESLSAKLLEDGLLHNLVAFYDEDTDKYILESGERRLRAFDLAHERFKDYEDSEDVEYLSYVEYIKEFYINGFPVNVKKAKYQDEPELSKVDEIDSNLRKYTANIDVRTFTPQQRAEYTQKVRTLMEEKNLLLYGGNPPKVTQAQVAEATGITERQIRKYEQIQELIPALKAEFEHGNLSINKVPTIAKMSEEEQLLFLDFLQREKNADPAQVKLYMERAEKAETEKRQLIEEKDQIESDLDTLRANRDDDIDRILEESKEREKQIREEIAKAEKEKNADRIIRLQNELAEEKNSASRMITDTNNRLEEAQGALQEAKQRIQELENQEQDTAQMEELEELLRIQTQLDMNFSFLGNLCSKLIANIESYKVLAKVEDIKHVSEMTLSMKELKKLLALIES